MPTLFSAETKTPKKAATSSGSEAEAARMVAPATSGGMLKSSIMQLTASARWTSEPAARRMWDLVDGDHDQMPILLM